MKVNIITKFVLCLNYNKFIVGINTFTYNNDYPMYINPKTKAETPMSRQMVVHLIRRGNEMNDAISLVVKQEGLTIQQFNVLRILRGKKDKPSNLQDVTQCMIHANSNTTRVVDKLISKKLVDRKQSKKDRRQIELRITKNGLNCLSRLDPLIDETENELAKNLSKEECVNFVQILEKL